MSIPNTPMAVLSTSNLEEFIFSSTSISNPLFHMPPNDPLDALAITVLK